MPITPSLAKDSTLTVKVAGRFDFATHRDFRSAYEHVSPAPSRYVVDLSQASYLDSSALGMLMILRQHAGEGDIVLANPQPDVRKVLQIANFEKLFVIR